MKRMLSLLVILCLLLPAAAMGEETQLPKVKFPAANYVGYLDAECVISMEIIKTGSFTGSMDLELRSQDGRVLGLLDEYTLFLPADADIQAGDRVRYKGQVFEIDGEVRIQPAALRLDHIELRLRSHKG